MPWRVRALKKKVAKKLLGCSASHIATANLTQANGKTEEWVNGFRLYLSSASGFHCFDWAGAHPNIKGNRGH